MEDVAAGSFTFTVNCNGSDLIKVRAGPHARVSNLRHALERELARRASSSSGAAPPPSGGRLFFAEHPLFEVGQPQGSELRFSDCGIGEGAKLLFMSAHTGGEVPPPPLALRPTGTSSSPLARWTW